MQRDDENIAGEGRAASGCWAAPTAFRDEIITLPEAIRRFDISPIIKIFGTWAVTKYGVECLVTYYPISKDRVKEPDAESWFEHIERKNWTIGSDFRAAYQYACNYFSKQKQRIPLGQKQRFLILKRDKYRCQMCGATAENGARLEVDHIIPKASGGKDTNDNLRVLCFDCNRGKGVDKK